MTPFVVTTFGTTDWFCTQCKLVFPGGLLLPAHPTDSAGIKAVIKEQERYLKLAHKAGYV